MTTGTVTHVDLEGGFYGILTDDGAQLFPLNLAEEFRQDGLRIRFQTEDAAVFTLAQWGRPVRLADVVKAD